MTAIDFQPLHPGLDPATTVMIDGYDPRFRMISHWPGHDTHAALRHDLTTGSALLYAEMSDARRREVIGDFSVVTNNHFDADGALSLFAMLRPEIALRHRDLMLRAARTGDFAVWDGADALAVELSLMTDLAQFVPFSTPPYNEERLTNLSGAYRQVFDRFEGLLAEPYKLRSDWQHRFDTVTADVARIEAGDGVEVTEFPDDDLALVVSDRPITIFGLRLAAGDLFRVLLVRPTPEGNRFRFCFRGESWWDVVSVAPKPRVELTELANRLQELEDHPEAHWWASPPDWVVPELGFGDRVTFELLAARIDPQIENDPASSLSVDTVIDELKDALRSNEPVQPIAQSADPAS